MFICFLYHLQTFHHTPKIIDPKSGVAKPVIVSVDDGIRPSTNMEILGKLKPAFKKNGCTTAGFYFHTIWFGIMFVDNRVMA